MTEHQFRRWLRLTGWFLLLASGLFVARAVYEQTCLARTAGLRMVGFSMGHASPGLFLLGFVFVLLSHGGAVITLVFLLKDRLWQNWESACLVARLILIPPLVRPGSQDRALPWPVLPL
jgi:hypothetical protein